jgi:spore coat protein CotH
MDLRFFLFIIAITLSGCGGSVSTPEPAEEPAISQFSFLSTNNWGLLSDIPLDQDETDKAFSGRVETNISVSELVASFQFTGSSVTVGGVVQESGISVNDFIDIVIYTVTNSDGDTQNYTVDLTKFTDLPIIYLKTDDFLPIESKEDYVLGDASIDGGRGFDDLAEVDMKIRGRGHSTWLYYPKKPFQMKLDNKVEFLGMPNDKKWLFLSEYSDKTMLRNKIAFEMGYLSNLDWTPQGRFAEVYINDQYNGTYNITQKVEESDNRVALDDIGYLLEIDQLDRLDSDDVYFYTNEFLINIKEPSLDLNSTEYLYIKDLINEFEIAMFGPGFLSPTEGYVKYIDIESFIDWYLINEITKNLDSKFFSSIYLNVMPGEKIKMGPLWDFDLSFVSDSEGWWVKDNPWYQRLFQDPVFVEQVKVRFAYFRDNQNLILEKIDAYAEQLQWAQQENDDKWQTIGLYVWPNPVFFDTYQEEVDQMKSWYIDRMEWLESAFTEL